MCQAGLGRALVSEVSRIAALIAGATTALLVAFSSGYGYHRDELYFLVAGDHLDWAYADQGRSPR